MADLSVLTNAPRVLSVTLDGREFKVRHMRMEEWGEVQAWIKDNVQSPAEAFQAFDMDSVSPYAARMAWDVALKAQRAWPPRVLSSEWHDALSGVGKDGRNGNVVFLRVALAACQPGFTYEQAADLFERVGAIEILPVVLAVSGVDPSDPKVRAALEVMAARRNGTAAGSPGPTATPATDRPTPTTWTPPTGSSSVGPASTSTS